MKYTFAFVMLLCGVVTNSTHAQKSENYSLTQVIAQLSNPLDVVPNNEKEITISDKNTVQLLANIGVARLEKLVRRNRNQIKIDEPLLIVFNQPVDVESTIKQLMQTGLFQVVEPDYIGTGDGVCEFLPNDTYFATRQWGLRNDGTFNVNSVVDADIDMEYAWSIAKGDTSIIVGVLDTGIKRDHPEFAGRLWINPGEILTNGADDDGNGFVNDIYGWDFVNNDNSPADDQGHGTNVSGIIAANGNNNLGYAGVDWNCKLLTAKVLNQANNGLYSWWISGIYYLVDNGVDVINMSMGGTVPSIPLQTAVNYAYVNNVPITVSMGNQNSVLPLYPANYPQVIAVGATDTDNERVNPFTWGGGSNYGNNIDICAPGNIIYGLSDTSNTYYNRYWGGTSQAAPLVSGVISLAKSLDNTLTIPEIKSLLYAGAVDGVGKPSEDLPGWDQYHGYGLLNAYNTLLRVNIGSDVQTACGQYTWIDGNTYTANNNSSTFITTTAAGCDSLVKLNLTIINSTASIDQHIACDNYTWIDGNNYTASNNTATYVITSTTGCDSTITLNLTIKPVSYVTDVHVACDSLTWLDGNTYYTDNNTAIWTLQNTYGCDSIITLDATIHQSSSSLLNISTTGIYTSPSGTQYIASGIYVETIHNIAGCDSTITIDLALSNPQIGNCDPLSTMVIDADGDGESCITDCDDSNPTLNNLDADGEGETSCDGDCDDLDPLLNNLDLDGDGFNSCNDDCDDSNPAINPVALEIGCDGIDNDCNPATSDILDGDGDGQTCDTDCDDNDTLLSNEDLDGDGYFSCLSDCNDNNPQINPGSSEIGCDGIDNDCNPATPDIFDQDGDGANCNVDCDDDDDNLTIEDNDGDGENCDTDCDDDDDELNNLDVDGDGQSTCAGDCDDTDPTTYIGAPEICDGIDNDCNNLIPLIEIDDDNDDLSSCQGDCNDDNDDLNQLDEDGDGQTTCQGDCDDDEITIYLGAPELCNEIDDDCNGIIPANELDIDNDNFSPCQGDCIDNNNDVNPNEDEIGCDGIDNDCNPATPDIFDQDGDGANCNVDCDDDDDNVIIEDNDGDGENCDTDCDDNDDELNNLDVDGDGQSTCAGDCDDTDPTTYIGAPEICDGIDNDCNNLIPLIEIDDDNDGLSSCQGDCNDDNDDLNQLDEDGDGQTTCQGDCDDDEITIYFGAPELCNEIDDDCNGIIPANELDADNDNFSPCQGDCIDNDNDVNPNEDEIGCDGIDNDCNPATPDIFDQDGDGANCNVDCDDDDDNVIIEDNDGDGENCDTDCDDDDDELNNLDVDGDGQSTCAGDCDHSDPTTYIGAPEICDGIDNDCNNLIPLIEIDDDNDGLSSCQGDCNDDNDDLNQLDEDGDGQTTCQGDCDDDELTIYFGAPELCDEIDNDCNGIIPANELDIDNDNFSPCQGDCIDNNNDVNPNEDEIGCDGIDNDCNPATPDIFDQDGDGANCNVDCDDDDDNVIIEDNDGDGENCDTDCDDNDDELNNLDVDGDGQSTCAGDCDDTDPTTYIGAPEICDGIDNDCNNLIPLIEIDDDNDDLSSCQGDCNDDNDDLNQLDEDGDGQTTCQGDCDDDELTIYFGAPELCDEIDNNCDGIILLNELDIDNDNYSPCQGDCNDNDNDISPNDDEIGCDGIDNDCNPATPDIFDEDGDGANCNVDCDDNNDNVIIEDDDGDGENCDTDCDDNDDELNNLDVDGDGQSLCDGDCNDTNPNVYWGAPELCNGIDNNCDGFIPNSEVDDDMDGVPLCSGDCDDSDPFLNDYDVDGDGQTSCQGDCDDFDETTYLGAPDICDGLDTNCDGILVITEIDQDGDGESPCEGDCDDFNANIFLGNIEICDQTDNNCDLQIDEGFDQDADGWSICDGDCNDFNLSAYPGAIEICDGNDNDCDGQLSIIEQDIDADGFTICDGDCDEGNPTINPGMIDIECNGIDDDCNPATLDDQTPPMAICLDIVVYIGETISHGQINDGSFDNCDVASITASQTFFSCADIGANSVMLTVIDAHGLSASCISTITVLDTIAPIPSSPSLPDINALCEVASLISPSGTENCGTLLISHDAILPISAQGTTVVTWTFDDGHGNSTSQTQNVIIENTIPPVPLQATLPNVTGECEVNSLPNAPLATENCGGTVVGTTTDVGPWSTQGTHTITWTFVDSQGNISNQNQTIIVSDLTPPTALCQDIVLYPGITGTTISDGAIDNGSFDNCDIATMSASQTFFSCADLGANSVVLTITDFQGHSASCVSTITVLDTLAPIPSSPSLPDISAQCEVASLISPTANDNCGTVSISHDAILPISTQGTTVVTWTFDDGHGNSTSQTQNVVIENTTPPVPLQATLPDVTGQCEVNLLPNAPLATENCGGTVVGTTTDVGPWTTQGTHTIIWTFVDSQGNISTQNQSVVISGLDVSTTTSTDGLTITATHPTGTYQWIDCDTDLPLFGETSQTYTATVNGSYAVIIEENGCTDTSECVVVASVGIAVNSMNGFMLYPNPSSDGFFTIALEQEITSIYVVDVLGRNVNVGIDQNMKEIDGSHLASGKYIVKIATENGVYTSEVVISR